MPSNVKSPHVGIPSVDRLLRAQTVAPLIERFGRPAVTDAVRGILAELRAGMSNGHAETAESTAEDAVIGRVTAVLELRSQPLLRPVFNLTGTVLHTNLGRAVLPEEAIDEMTRVARGASNLEYDLERGKRGDRDDHLEETLRRLTGAEAATVVNNNAAAVMLVLNSLALGKEVPVSRGELIEIGGSFRIPDIMARSGCTLREVGTTNRTHPRDFEQAIGPDTGMVMKVHTSNYTVEGFTAAVPERALAKLCHERGIPFAVDLGSGTLVGLERYGLPHEPTASETLADGADVVTFSGDKLLGGPQAGIVVGRADLIAEIKRNPMKRALRCDKVTIAALSAVLRLYDDPDRLADRVPTLRMLARPADEIAALAERLQPAIAARLGGATVDVVDCESQIGSGALPTRRIPSKGLAIRPKAEKRGEPKAGKQGEPKAEKRSKGTALNRLSDAFRNLPVPVIGRIQDDTFILDLRCLEDEAAFTDQLSQLDRSDAAQ